MVGKCQMTLYYVLYPVGALTFSSISLLAPKEVNQFVYWMTYVYILSQMSKIYKKSMNSKDPPRGQLINEIFMLTITI